MDREALDGEVLASPSLVDGGLVCNIVVGTYPSTNGLASDVLTSNPLVGSPLASGT